jgi:hypothetical protein
LGGGGGSGVLGHGPSAAGRPTGQRPAS